MQKQQICRCQISQEDNNPGSSSFRWRHFQSATNTTNTSCLACKTNKMNYFFILLPASHQRMTIYNIRPHNQPFPIILSLNLQSYQPKSFCIQNFSEKQSYTSNKLQEYTTKGKSHTVFFSQCSIAGHNTSCITSSMRNCWSSKALGDKENAISHIALAAKTNCINLPQLS